MHHVMELDYMVSIKSGEQRKIVEGNSRESRNTTYESGVNERLTRLGPNSRNDRILTDMSRCLEE